MCPPDAASVLLYAAPCIPFAKELVVMFTTDSIVKLSVCVAVCAVGVVESVTCIVKFDVPVALGVPEMTPVEAAKLKPAGRDPELMLQL